ncbi:MAG: hypothetical protein JWR38_1551 [Mucilaginibacter sp.]|nr:hypothetical protein [Mucilaginibacter sp.]
MPFGWLHNRCLNRDFLSEPGFQGLRDCPSSLLFKKNHVNPLILEIPVQTTITATSDSTPNQ